MTAEYVQLGRTSLRVSLICFGCWQMGQTFWGLVPEKDLAAAVHKALDLGINLFDTADAYGDGLAEEILGRALKGVPRESYILATKVYHHCLPERNNARHPDLSYEYIIWECDQSLRRLGVETIDLYQAHAFDVLTHPEETARAFEVLKQRGKIRYAGCSNYSVEQLRAALRFGRMDTLQPHYNLLTRDAEEDLFPFCMAEGIGVLAYSPLQHGLLCGKFAGNETFTDFRAGHPMFRGDEFRKNVARVNRLRPIAAEYGLTITQLVLTATFAHPAVTCAIVGIKNSAQIEEAAGAMGKSISRWDYYQIRDALTVEMWP
jgi:aryl-alcohol dehydrogenase-like predicted oxidoreductase